MEAKRLDPFALIFSCGIFDISSVSGPLKIPLVLNPFSLHVLRLFPGCCPGMVERKKLESNHLFFALRAGVGFVV